MISRRGDPPRPSLAWTPGFSTAALWPLRLCFRISDSIASNLILLSSSIFSILKVFVSIYNSVLKTKE